MRYCGQISFQYLFSLSFCHVQCRARAKITQQVQKCTNVAPENLLSDDTKVLERKVNKCWQSPCCWSLLNPLQYAGLGLVVKEACDMGAPLKASDSARDLGASFQAGGPGDFTL